MQEQINKSFDPLWVKQINDFRKDIAPLIQQYQKLAELLSENIAPIANQYRLIQESLAPFIKAISDELSLLQQVRIPASMIQGIFEWQETIQKINNSEILGIAVPGDICASLSEFTFELEDRVDASSSLSASLTVAPNVQCEKHSLTWYQLLMILLAVLPIIVPYHINYMNSVQLNTQNQKLINDLRYQHENDELQLRIERAREQRLEEKFSLLMEAVKQSISEKRDTAEVSHEDD